MTTEQGPNMIMHIGELAEKSKMSLRTIRHYDEVGLLKPSGRSEGGFRLYTADDLDRLLLIRQIKALGFSLEDMADILHIIQTLQSDNAAADTPGTRVKLDGYLEQALERRTKLQDYLARGDEIIATLEALSR
ncbi:MerR family transcriptional regulator [Cryobacterium psychrophilum]|uniref:MerR family transcriptional regulator n=1 Tax=Cryobacterium psychrophilum TaxID=41988 RepID=A0A4Y8KIY6_9MICO|nr:MerR family transcriptional regulator [Cryobacterium psychrophilum]TDW30806.1 DNA-binding transcriptional MerR regulator [Cryobacterium psychrophilum]TFD75797.1 MerR family transcriptional regulator [Cryobacterium psychrophilum]